MKNENFIQLGDDPTLPIDDLESRYSNLSDHEKLLIAAKVGLQMNHLPVDIIRFVSDSYYLGDPRITNEGKTIFEKWKEVLKEIFPSPILTKYPYISFSG